MWFVLVYYPIKDKFRHIDHIQFVCECFQMAENMSMTEEKTMRKKESVVSPFPTVFSQAYFSRVIHTKDCSVKCG